MTREKWLLEKKKFMTSTDPAVLLGMGFKNQSAQKIYDFKTSPDLIEEEPSELMELGTYLEEYIRRKVVERFNSSWAKMGFELIKSRKNDWQATSIDLMDQGEWIWGQTQVIETKCIFGYPSSEWGPDGTDLVPEKYIIQCQHQMGVLELQEMRLAALFVSSGELRIYTIGFDKSLFEMISFVEKLFWAIIVDRENLGDFHSDTWNDYIMKMLPVIRDRLPKVKDGVKIILESDAEMEIQNYIEAKEMMDQLEEEASNSKEKLIHQMGDAEIGETERFRIKRPLVRGKNPYRKFIVEEK